MKALLVALTIVVTGLVAAVGTTGSAAEPTEVLIPPGYYDAPCQQPAGVALHHWLAMLEMPAYEEDAFDCSQRAAYIEWLAENCGYDTLFVAKGSHMWVMVEGVPFETGKNPRWADDDEYHATWELEVDSLQGFTELDYFDEEFGWWLSHPEEWTQ